MEQISDLAAKIWILSETPQDTARRQSTATQFCYERR